MRCKSDEWAAEEKLIQLQRKQRNFYLFFIFSNKKKILCKVILFFLLRYVNIFLYQVYCLSHKTRKYRILKTFSWILKLNLERHRLLSWNWISLIPVSERDTEFWDKITCKIVNMLSFKVDSTWSYGISEGENASKNNFTAWWSMDTFLYIQSKMIKVCLGTNY